MASSNHIKSKCLGLGPSCIGSKVGIVGGNVIDDIAKQKLKCLPLGMIAKIEDYLRDRFPEVYNHKLNKIISIPEDYDYGVETKKGMKARAMQYGDETDARKTIARLAGSKDWKDIRERSHLEEILKDKKPYKCEDGANRRFKNFFKNEPGLFTHGFKPKEYLKEIKKIAVMLGQGSRKSYKSNPKLDRMEIGVLELLGMTEGDVKQWVDDRINDIQIKTAQIKGAQTSNGVTGDIICQALQSNIPKERTNQFKQLKNKFPKNQRFTFDEVRAKLLDSEFEYATNFDDEYDMFLILPNHEMIIAAEQKQAMTPSKTANDAQAKSASKQLKKSEAFMRNVFGELLSSGWKYIKVAVLYDNHGSFVSNRCPGCSHYILTNGTEAEEHQQMEDLWQAITGSPYSSATSQSNHSGLEEFKHLFSRLIGFSGESFIVQKVGHYHEIMGTNPSNVFASGITAGWTTASPLTFGSEDEMIKNGLRFGDMMGRPHDVFKIIFWNPNQRKLLDGNHRFVLFSHDYGAGKLYDHYTTNFKIQ